MRARSTRAPSLFPLPPASAPRRSSSPASPPWSLRRPARRRRREARLPESPAAPGRSSSIPRGSRRWRPPTRRAPSAPPPDWCATARRCGRSRSPSASRRTRCRGHWLERPTGGRHERAPRRSAAPRRPPVGARSTPAATAASRAPTSAPCAAWRHSCGCRVAQARDRRHRHRSRAIRSWRATSAGRPRIDERRQRHRRPVGARGPTRPATAPRSRA